MITKTDWDEALDAWIDGERERLGGPPSPEDVVAFLGGELSPAEAARVRALLVYYPELTPLLDERIEKPRRARALQLYAIAATFAVALLAADAIHQRLKSRHPVVPSTAYELTALRARGDTGPAYALPAGQQRYLITAIPSEPPDEQAPYDFEITRDGRVVWRARDVRPLNDAFVVDIPGEFLTPGTYTLNVNKAGRIVERYPFIVR